MILGDFYSKLKDKEKILFFICLGFILLALMDRLVLGPILAQLQVLDSEISTKHETLRRNLRVLSFRDSIVNEYSKYELYLDSGEKTPDEIVSALLKMIETLSKQNQIAISNVQPGDVVENPLYKEYLTSIECEGSLPHLLSFMDALETSDFLFRIMKFQFTAKSKTGEILKANIDISRILIAAENIPGREPKSAEKPTVPVKSGPEPAAQDAGASPEETPGAPTATNENSKAEV